MSSFATLSDVQKDLAYKRGAEHVSQVRDAAIPKIQALQEEITRRKKERALDESVPPIFFDFYKPSRYKGAFGGRGSAKSHSIATLLIRKAKRNKGLRAVCVREIQKSLEQSVKRLLEDKIEAFGLQRDFRILNTHIETPGDGIIGFIGMQNHTAESIKSLEGYDVAWVEEAQTLSSRSLELLRPTIRKAGSELWFTWNPRYATDPIDELLRGGTLPPSAIVKEVNFHHNPYFPAELQMEMEWDRSRDIDKYNHIWLGQYERKSEARVFKNWRVESFETPRNATFYLGGDWGFAKDPTVLVRIFFDLDNRKLYIDDSVFKVGCEVDHIPALFDKIGEFENKGGMARNWTIRADSARPETISYLNRHGYPLIIPAKKGAGSVEEGVTFLQNFDIIVHPRNVEVIDELTMYSYKTDPLTGDVLPKLEDKKNHGIDASRYAVEELITGDEGGATW